MDTSLYGIDWDGPISCDDDTCRVAVPETVNPLRPIDYAQLRAVIATASASNCELIEQYSVALQFVQEALSHY